MYIGRHTKAGDGRIPGVYRLKFQSNIFKDLHILEKSIGDEETQKLRPTEQF